LGTTSTAVRSLGGYCAASPEACRAFCSTIDSMLSRIVFAATNLGNTAVAVLGGRGSGKASTSI
jgi:hypothetical protein